MAGIVKIAKAGPKGLEIELRADEAKQAGIKTGDAVMVKIRRYTAEDWLKRNEGRIYYSAKQMDEAFGEYLALPEQ